MSNWMVDNPKFKANFPPVARAMAHVVVIIVSIAVYCRVRDSMNEYYEVRSDKEAITTPSSDQVESPTDKGSKNETAKVANPKASISDEYFEGAIEYYSKQIQKNKAYRRLLGKEGPKFFTREGDERWTFVNWLMKPSSVPLTARLKYLQDTVDYHQKDSEDNGS